MDLMCRYTPDGQVAWAMLASHNMSKAAWGQLQKSKSQLQVLSYEMGVLFLPDLELHYRQHRHHGFCCGTGAFQCWQSLLVRQEQSV